jgi:arylsulfatase A-like enzyme
VPPNVLLVVADDQRPDTVGPFDDGSVSTPHLDEIAANGCAVRPYTTVPVCTPARAELYSGATIFENNCRWFGKPLDEDATLLPEALGDAGYQTFFSGKWHNQPDPETAGFDRTRIIHEGPDLDHENRNDYLETGHTYRLDWDGHEFETHGTEAIVEPAEDFLLADPGTPWLCTVAFHAPHEPFDPPASFDTYDPDDVAVPPNFMSEHPFDNGHWANRDEQTEPWPRTPEMVRDLRARYYGQISHIDHAVGRLLTALERTGQREDTIVVFTSDHGLAVGSHGLLGKQSMYEHSARVPLVIDGPGVETRAPPGALCGHYDFLPTLCDLLGVETPQSATGESYAPVLRGESDDHREHMFGAYSDCMRMARDDRWKLIYYPESNHVQLFDLEQDPNETQNLLAEWRPYEPTEWAQSWMPDYEPPADPETVDAVASDLLDALRAWSAEKGDSVDVPDAVPVTVGT